MTTTDTEYALMAGNAYRSTRDKMNWISAPQGWSEFKYEKNESSGFEAVSFQNTANPNEIVISFAGTGSGMNQDWWANCGLVTGFGAEQLLQAAEYYLQVKALNPNATITFTGHSLGGGLAALMGVFFNKQAVTFDQAPFLLSAEKNLLNPDVAATLRDDLLLKGYSETLLIDLYNFLETRTLMGPIPNSNMVRAIHVDGEVLSVWFPISMIGLQTPPLTHGPTDLSSTNLHSQALLTAFMENDQFRKITFKLTDLLGMIFDSNLYYNDPNKLIDPKRNFLENLVRHQAGVQGSFAADGMLDRFTTDLQLIAGSGSTSMSDANMTKALTAFAMQAYYDNRLAVGETLFDTENITGGLHFDRSKVAGMLEDPNPNDGNDQGVKGYTMYFKAYLETIPAEDRTFIEAMLPELLDW